MQVIPRFVSTNADGGDEREFLRESFGSVGEMNSSVFLKGYQWPFDSRKVIGGSSLVDILVYIETVVRGRRVFLDFRRNPEGFRFEDLSEEARSYLAKSNALQATPLERLRAMNPGAIELYAEHGINLASEPLEIAVCAQHNNGGLAANHWWESLNVRHLFPVGEVNGSHGVYRPGGSALNSGQVGGFRAAEFIANRCSQWTLTPREAGAAARETVRNVLEWAAKCSTSARSWQEERSEFQTRMGRCAAHIRSADALKKASGEAWAQWRRIEASGCGHSDAEGLHEAIRNRHLCFAHAVYLDAVRFAVDSGVGSRGSAIVLDSGGQRIHDRLGADWAILPEDEAFRCKVQETDAFPDGWARHRWVERRAIPASDAWFETAWAGFRAGRIYDP
jgi:succinate dehydrogenase/fumarate reductase flavoprotein subunit